MPIPGVFVQTLFVPEPGSDAAHINIIPSIIESIITQQEQRGTAFIVNQTLYQSGVARIRDFSNSTTTVSIAGTISIRNPLQFIPGFQEYPVLTNTELNAEFQKGVACIWSIGEQQTTQTLEGVARILQMGLPYGLKMLHKYIQEEIHEQPCN